MTAIPNYARMNRVGAPVEWLGDSNVNYAPGTSWREVKEHIGMSRPPGARCTNRASPLGMRP
jgi:hypothetical protein